MGLKERRIISFHQYIFALKIPSLPLLFSQSVLILQTSKADLKMKGSTLFLIYVSKTSLALHKNSGKSQAVKLIFNFSNTLEHTRYFLAGVLCFAQRRTGFLCPELCFNYQWAISHSRCTWRWRIWWNVVRPEVPSGSSRLQLCCGSHNRPKTLLDFCSCFCGTGGEQEFGWKSSS